MGNCNSKTTNNFIDYIIIDKQIILGIWNNPKNLNKTNTMSFQGICFNNSDQIYELKYMIKPNGINTITYNFDNGIMLKITKNHDDIDIFYKDKNITFTKNMEDKYIKKIKKISNNSDEIDLLYDLCRINQ